ncbi:hypothetical protein IEQ34_002579 [Dendrobium chrysotoxum]|uniref:Uncharacterized protein n=1 Tax=Dendrobium chrysotoxum TaxID=161865 RepID=A0AAV7HEY4_DENCH|nr:hypothetical protein IEQ34_002579 [Dendrobium chrysotoxum]
MNTKITWIKGLKDKLSLPLVPLKIQDFLELKERTRIDMSRKRVGEEGTKGEYSEKRSKITNVIEDI